MKIIKAKRYSEARYVRERISVFNSVPNCRYTGKEEEITNLEDSTKLNHWGCYEPAEYRKLNASRYSYI